MVNRRRALELPRSRNEAVARLRRDLQVHGWPRSQMTLLVSLTGASGLLASFLLLQAGMSNMALRYPMSLLVAYGVFFLLLWLWLRTRAEDWSDAPDPGVGFPDLSPDMTTASGHGTPPFSSGGGGNFGGGGASASFDAPARVNPLLQSPQLPSNDGFADASGSDSFGELGSAADVAEAEELVIPLLVIALAMGLALSSFYVIYSAPTLLAELLLDGALSATLYRCLRGIERRHWVATALRKTVLPFVLTGLLLVGAGWGLQSVAPGARSVGEAFRHISATN